MLVLALLLVFLLQILQLLVLLIGESLVVDVHLIGLGHGLGLADNPLQVVKLLQFEVVEFHQLVVVEALVLESVAHDTLHVYLLQLFEHTGHIELAHL